MPEKTKKSKKSKKSSKNDENSMDTSEQQHSSESKAWSEVQNFESVPLPSRKHHTNETHEAWLIELAPGINIHDLDGCKIKLPEITESSRREIVENQATAQVDSYNFEDPLVDTKLEDGDRVRKIKNCNENLLYRRSAK